jgi:SAM-dependent methyltransferase
MESVIMGRDPKVLDQLFGFYARPEGPVLDVTANRRRMWKGLETRGVLFADRDPVVIPDVCCDFRRLPFASNSFSAVVFDPPHLPAAAGSEKSSSQYKRDYGLDSAPRADSIESYFQPFLQEALRVLKPDGLVFAKLIDFVHNHAHQWTLHEFLKAVPAGLTATDLLIKINPSRGLTSGRWVKSHHARRVHTWWIVLRKGRCEPRRDYPAQPQGRFVA